ncbi:hypothetical protein NTJ56_27010 [Burkholderia contaminans]|uniref:hypothetical protein n=1 Tax=Burkholderia contaminans TaxID=488447 RepID=UPI001CF50DAF|nr:hypothetical protein [Burkholderia contaminans]MCA7913831.1 hypothetical protein [Burkholderia contaminans]MCA8101977.1 hypothetical protein [Burkholderia contaminans]UUX41862.1 hypothetical protein NTJ56_27010 [Burkholderia contaminans]
MLAVERLEDRQAFFEAGNPVASVEFGLFHRLERVPGCAVIAREWAIIAQIGSAATLDHGSYHSMVDACPEPGTGPSTTIGDTPNYRARRTRATDAEDMPKALLLIRRIADTNTLATPR